MIRRLRHLVRNRGNRDRQLIISGSILAIVCIALVINLTIMLTKSSSNQNKKPINNETNETISNTTVLSTTVIYKTEKFLNHTLEFGDPMKYETYGCPLENALYFNYPLVCHVDGSVVSVDLRLFSVWKGYAPLYLFVIEYSMVSFNILRRYAVNPQRNTTEWQTINIPSGALPIHMGCLFGIGMQDKSGSTNEIYAVKTTFSIAERGINESTTIFTGTVQRDIGVALSYTVVYNDQKTSTKSTTID